MPLHHYSRKKKQLAALIMALALFFFGLGRKILEFALPSIGEKDCSLANPKTFETTPPATLISLPSTIPFFQRGGVINDASCLNQTAIAGVVRVTSVDDVRDALLYAREHDLMVSIAGERHSMGGQAFQRGGLVLDMHGLDAIVIDAEHRTMTVGAGARWIDIQHALDPQGLAVAAMQSINIFTVGGTLSVNAHGIAHHPGSVASTVRSLRIMQSDGTIVTASRTEHPEFFAHALGGYGLFGVILDATIDVVPNELYQWETMYTTVDNFPAYYKDRIDTNDNVGLTYARISVSPTSYLSEVAVHTFTKTVGDTPRPSIQKPTHDALMRFVINVSKTGSVGRWLRWTLEKQAIPRFAPCITRNDAMQDDGACRITRNQGMYDSMGYLNNRLPDTDILQEYFVPRERMPDFVNGLRSIVERNDANLLNVTIRNVQRDTVTALPYATDDLFAFVLYVNQKLTLDDTATMKKTTTELIDLATSLGGTFYLPYQLVYSPEQLRAAYPGIGAFFAAKSRFDPDERLTNAWYEKYGKESRVLF